MAHRAERIRKEKIKALEQERQLAEKYSWELNWHWNKRIKDAFGLSDATFFPPFDLTYYYDELVRQTNPQYPQFPLHRRR